MHQPTLVPHSSTYFTYQILPFQRPTELDGPGPVHPVTVVGAGPVGLLTAIFLKQHGVDCVLLTAEAQVSGGSRALAFTRRSMEIFEQAGVAEAILKDALVWREGRSYFRNREVHHLRIPGTDDDKFAPMTNLPQCMVEEILIERARTLGVDLRFQTRLVAMAEDAEGVTLQCDTPQGEYALRTQWLVAADGARSPIRKMKDLRFTGQSFEGRFVIADIQMAIDAAPGRRCYFDPPWLPGEAALMHKAPFDIWRLDYRVPDDVSDEEAMDRERIRGQIQAHLDSIGVAGSWVFDWVTLYKPNALTLESYRHGRVMLVGDAAHLLPVFGVRGLNTGAQDAINLGWKLAAVVQGLAPDSLLDTFSEERVADARQICVEAARSTRMMAPPSRGHAVLRRAVLSLALDHAFVRDLLHWRTSHPIDYDASLITWHEADDTGFAGGPGPGAPARNVQLESGAFLLDGFAPGFQILLFAPSPAAWHDACQTRAAWQQRGVTVRLWQIGGPAMAADAEVKLADTDGRVARAWGVTAADAVVVLRPDQHVGGRVASWRTGVLNDILARNLGHA